MTNTRQTVSIPVQKTWVNVTDQQNPASVSVQLTRNGADYLAPVTLSDNADPALAWQHTFKNLPKTDNAGVNFAYAVKELAVPGYTSQISPTPTGGFTITNTRDTTSVKVSKVWVNDLGLPNPESISVQLTQNGSDYLAPATLSDNADPALAWQHTFNNLPKFDNAGAEFVYAVKELALPGYESAVTGTPAAGLVLTNTILPPDPVTYTLTATKRLTGMNLSNNQFTFEVTLPDGTVTTVKNAADGTIEVPEQSFDLPDTYVFKLREIAGSVAGMSYDSAKYEVSVTVTYDVATATLSLGEVTITRNDKDYEGDILFENDYVKPPVTTYPTIKVDLDAKKTLRGRALKAGEFGFTIKDASGKVLETVQNAKDGTVDFAPRTFSRTGRFLYQLEEVKGKTSRIVYDKTVYTALVEVTANNGALSASVTYQKDGVPFAGTPNFTNRYRVPETGDRTPLLIITLLSTSLLLLGATLYLKRTRKGRTR